MDESVINTLEGLPFFTKAAFVSVERLNHNALSQNIKRWVRRGHIIRLKNGLFVTKTFVDRSIANPAYTELLAGCFLSPSYLSLESILQKNQLLTEATFTISSVTTKSGRTFTNPVGHFVYHTVKADLYFGFEKKLFGKNAYYSARPAKALFDFLYLRLPRLDPRDPSTIEALRLNWGALARSVFDEFCLIVRRCRIKKMREILPIIERECHGNAH